MDKSLARKAEILIQLHHEEKLLILPNIWDVIGGLLLKDMGFPAVATASASIAFSHGYDDGQNLSFEELLPILKRICQRVDLPVSVDIERGYAETSEELEDNIKALITIGVAGINIEDSLEEGGALLSIEQQCNKIQLIKKTANKLGIPLCINARTDVFISSNDTGRKLAEAIDRGRAYIDAGASCFYPILSSNEDLVSIRKELKIPINALATQDLMSMQELENNGIARLSLGPAFLKAALAKMKEVASSLKSYQDYHSFTGENTMSSNDVRKLL